MDPGGRKVREDAASEAARWVIRVRSGAASPAELGALAAWRRARPEHEIAYQWEEYVWERTDRLMALQTAPAAADVSLQDEVVAAASAATAGPVSPAGGERRRGRGFALAAAATIVLVSGAVFLWRSREQPVDVGGMQRYATELGERRSVLLADGSRVELNTASEIEVRLTGAERRVELVRGESLFDVEPDSARPFVVAVGGDVVRAVGTSFNIRRDVSSTIVLVTEGTVEVVRGDGADGTPDPLRVSAGSLAIHDGEGFTRRTIATGELERALSWRFGAILLAGETLAQAAVEFNRYNRRILRIDDESIAGLRLGGYFNARDVEAFLQVIVPTYALEARVDGDVIGLRATSGTRARIAENAPGLTVGQRVDGARPQAP